MLATVLAAAQQSSGGGSLIFLVLIVGVGFMFWFSSRNARKQRQRVQDVQSRLLPGQQVLTGSGIYGTIAEAFDDRVRLEIAPGVAIMVAKQSVVRTVDDEPVVSADVAASPAPLAD